MPYSEEPIIRGWLNKLKSSKFKIGGKWNRRWVTIQNIGMGELALCYWNGPPTPTEENDPSGWIFLKEVDELYSGKDPLPTTFLLGNRKTSESQRLDYVESEISKNRETVFVISAFSRNFVFNAPDLESYRHWMAVLVRLCGLPFIDHPWQKHWGKEVVIPDKLKELWCKTRKNCPYRNSQYNIVSLSARKPQTIKEKKVNNSISHDLNLSSSSSLTSSQAKKNIVLHASYQRLSPAVHDDSPSVSINEDSPNHTSITSNTNNISSIFDNVETFDLEDNDKTSEPPKYNHHKHRLPTMEELKEVDPEDEELSRSNDNIEAFKY